MNKKKKLINQREAESKKRELEAKLKAEKELKEKGTRS